MNDDRVGYGRPPKHSRFKPGTSGNPAGRPKRPKTPIAQLIADVLQAPIEFRRRGVTKSVTRHEFSLMMLVDRAVAGDFEAAETLLRIWEYAERHGGGGLVVKIHDWWPDADGQTAHQKSHAVGKGRRSLDLPPEPEER